MDKHQCVIAQGHWYNAEIYQSHDLPRSYITGSINRVNTSSIHNWGSSLFICFFYSSRTLSQLVTSKFHLQIEMIGLDTAFATFQFETGKFWGSNLNLEKPVTGATYKLRHYIRSLCLIHISYKCLTGQFLTSSLRIVISSPP